MNIQNFEQFIDSKILQRGKDYYTFGHIISLEYENDKWVAEVDGSEEYSISISLSGEGEILNTYCDCPYDFGIYCKHQVAVFFALKSKGMQLLHEAKTQSSNKKEKLEDILANLDKQTLVSLLIGYANTYKPIKNELKFRFASKADAIKSARDVIRSSINSVKHRGFVEYSNVSTATDGADTVLRTIDDKIKSGDLLAAISLGIVVAEEMMELLDYCDDSNGYVGETISNAISSINEAVLAIPDTSSDSKKVFDTILAHALSGIYNGWTDWEIDLLATLIPLCGNKENRLQLEHHLDLNNQTTSDFSYDWELQQKQKIQLEIIARFDGEATAQQFLNRHLENDDFRRMAIKCAIEGRDYDRAIELCIEGESTNSQYAGIVKDMRKLRYTAYEAAGKKDEQKALALLLLQDGEFDYYLKYKKLHSKEEWIAVLYDILEKTEGSRGIYVKIIVHEKHKPRLLAYCESFPYAIVEYHKHLLPEYKQEVGLIFSDHIRQLASRADNRGRYHEVCQLIKTCDSACPDATSNICAEIISEYARRPAFMDEMRKINKL